MAGEFADEAGVFDLFIKVADKGSSGHMTAGDVGDAFLFVASGDGVSDCNHPVDAGFAEDFFDGVVVILPGNEGEEMAGGAVFVFV